MRIHHLAMRTRRLVRLESFYTTVLGFSVIHRDGTRSVWLAAGDAIVMLEDADAGEPGIAPGTMELVAFAVGKEDVARHRRILAENNVAVEAETVYTIYFRDPDGRRIALSHFPGEGART